MKLLYYFSTSTLTNIYVVGPDNGGDALIVDPGALDVPLLEMIEHNDYYIRSILVTHELENHLRGIRTLLRVYDAQLFASKPQVLEYPATPVGSLPEFWASGMRVEPITLPGYWSDALVFHLGDKLFVGEVLSAGMMGVTINGYARALLQTDIRERILTLPGNTLLLPTEGPPSTVTVEERTNTDLRATL